MYVGVQENNVDLCKYVRLYMSESKKIGQFFLIY